MRLTTAQSPPGHLGLGTHPCSHGGLSQRCALAPNCTASQLPRVKILHTQHSVVPSRKLKRWCHRAILSRQIYARGDVTPCESVPFAACGRQAGSSRQSRNSHLELESDSCQSNSASGLHTVLCPSDISRSLNSSFIVGRICLRPPQLDTSHHPSRVGPSSKHSEVGSTQHPKVVLHPDAKVQPSQDDGCLLRHRRLSFELEKAHQSSPRVWDSRLPLCCLLAQRSTTPICRHYAAQ